MFIKSYISLFDQFFTFKLIQDFWVKYYPVLRPLQIIIVSKHSKFVKKKAYFIKDIKGINFSFILLQCYY